MPIIQDTIHKLEVAGGLRYFKIVLAVAAVAGLAVWYDLTSYKNMATQEAMDAAQLGRNLAQGKGYTTLFVRPFSMYLLKRHNQERVDRLDQARREDLSQIKGAHPDIANAPVYPVMLATLMKVLPFRFPVDTTRRFWSIPKKPSQNKDDQTEALQEEPKREFWRYQPDFIIAMVNQCLFIGIIVLVFFLARKLFGNATGWASAAVLFGTELFWRFSVSGLSTMLLVFIFMLLIWCLVLIEEGAREVKWGTTVLVVLGLAVGLLAGLGGLTRYAFGWLGAPVLVFLLLFGGANRFSLAVAALIGFGGVMAPWIARNYHVSGTPFGTAGYAIYDSSLLFPENRLGRSLEPDFNRPRGYSFSHKLLTNTRKIAQEELPKLTGSWLGAFFLVGLMLPLASAGASRLRYFLLLCLALLVVVQALGRTQLSEDSPEINTENLLVLLAPLILVYGVALFFMLLNQLTLPIRELRYAIIGCFAAIACLPMLFTFLPPRTVPLTYPPYHPPSIQTISGWLKENEMSMSDIPWAMAWYGQRQSLWLTLSIQPDFYNVTDFQKPIVELYLTRVTIDKKFLTQWLFGSDAAWGQFALKSILENQAPPNFPLRKTQPGWAPEQLVLTDWERWRKAD